jgi:GNAT superfamily N-acetyltransferase
MHVKSNHPCMIASSADAPVVAALLQAFSEEFGDPTPGVEVLAERLVSIDAVALLAGEPVVGVALMTFRSSVWTVGPTALLEELYVVPAQRGRGDGRALLLEAMVVARARGAETFELYTGEGDAAARALYKSHGLRNTEPGETDSLLYYHRRL